MAARKTQRKADPSARADLCGGGAGSISLPVLPSSRPPIRKSKNSHRRAIILIAVQVLILAHIALWLLAREYGWFGGRTLTPVEPSEAMQTIELGAINAGAIFFGVVLLSTLIFGRFFCGWACHIVMLQDFCAWIMKKCGVRPKPFRSRILVWAPLILALYMFIWPTFKRLALFPILDRMEADGLASFFKPVATWSPEWHLTTERFWSTFSVIMALPTLLIVGFAAVYFLGSKGFCTYGCPYGGFFGPLDEFAIGRIRVDHDKCEGCGHCTATCTSNVRVHEEVREFGMVVDPGCMKCMDCVSVCPNDALSFGFGRPATGKGKAKTGRILRQYDLSRGEDIALAVIFIAILLAVRGLYLWEGVPLLMAVGIAGVLSFLFFKTWRLFAKGHDIVRVQNVNLKWRGNVTVAGWVFAAMTIALTGLVIQNGIVNYHRFRADLIIRRTTLQYAQAPREIARPPEMLAGAIAAIAHLERAFSISDGGFALMTEPTLYSQMAAMHGVRGEFAAAASHLRRQLDITGPNDRIAAGMVHLMYLDGRGDEALADATSLLAEHPDWSSMFDEVIVLTRDLEGRAEAIAFARARLSERAEDVPAMRALAELLAYEGPFEEAVQLSAKVLQYDGKDIRAHRAAAEAFLKSGDLPRARDAMIEAIEQHPRDPSLRLQMALILRLMGEEDLAQTQEDLAERLHEEEAR